MGWIKNLLPEADEAEYQEAMERAWEDAHLEWWIEQDAAMKNDLKDNDNAK